MAKQAGNIKITGTVYNVCFYKLGSQYYARAKSSLTGKRVKKDSAFRRTMQNAGLLAKASSIASSVYRKLPPNQRDRRLYQQLTGNAIRLLRQGLHDSDVATAITTNLYNGSTVIRHDNSGSQAQEEIRVRRSDTDTPVNSFIFKDHQGNLHLVLPALKKCGTYADVPDLSIPSSHAPPSLTPALETT